MNRTESFGVLLRRFREAAGLSQEKLAARARLSANAVGALERGVRQRPYPHTVRSLAQALGLSTEEHATLQAAVSPRERSSSTKPAAAEAASGKEPGLPTPTTMLVGRARELAELGELLGSPDTRLVTLTGIGGVGKTRLALEASRQAVGSFSDGAVFVRLAPLSAAAMVTSTVLRALGTTATEGQNPDEVLIRYLQDKQLLLVLDNFEHLLQAAHEVAGWLEASPRLTVLATSRAPLRLQAEIEYQVPPLSLPASSRTASGEEVLDSDSGRLFVQRARASTPGFSLTRHNAAEVAAICWRLAGLPLALELAAARTRFLDPATLLSRLDEALSIAWARDLPERQRTMRATLDWSYALLEKPQQQLLQRLSVFSGGFTLEAAEAVGVGSRCERSTLEHLGALVEQSLVQVRQDTGYETRYVMLEPVRQYACEKLGEGEAAVDARRRHAGFYLDLAERASSRLWGAYQGEWLDHLDRDNSNLRAAITWALQTGEADTAGRFCWALWLFWWIRGYHQEGRHLSEGTLETDLHAPLRARILAIAAAMAYTENDFETAEDRWREGLRLSRQVDELLGEGYCRAGTGLAELVRGDYAQAGMSFGKALPILEQCEDQGLTTLVRVWLGTTLLMRGDSYEAERSIENGLRSARSRNDTLCTYVALYNLAQLRLARNELEPATAALREGIELSEHTRDRANLAHFLSALSAVAALQRQPERSATLSGAAEGILREVGAPIYNFYRPDTSLTEKVVGAARATLGESNFEALRECGEAMRLDGVIAYALEHMDAPGSIVGK